MPKITVEITQPNDEKHVHQIFADGYLIGNIWDTVDRVEENPKPFHKYFIYFTNLSCIYADEVKYVTYKPAEKLTGVKE